MNFVQLVYFAEVARTKSLNKAAKNCYISYQAMNKAITSLEDDLQTKLFIRSHNGAILTENGEKFYKDVLKILDMQKSWTEFSDTSTTTVNILSISVPCTTILNKIIPEISKKHPQINLSYSPIHAAEIPDKLLDPSNSFRIALSCTQVSPPDIRSFCQKYDYHCDYLYTGKHVAILSSDLVSSNRTSISLQELKQFPGVFFSEIQSKELSAEIFNQQTRYSYYLEETKIQTIVEYHTATLISEQVADIGKKIFGDKIVVLPIDDFNYAIDYYIIYPQFLTSAEKLVVDYIKDFSKQYA